MIGLECRIIAFGRFHVSITKLKDKTLQAMLTPGVETPGYRLSIYGLVNLTRMIVATPYDWFSSFELKYEVFY